MADVENATHWHLLQSGAESPASITWSEGLQEIEVWDWSMDAYKHYERENAVLIEVQDRSAQAELLSSTLEFPAQVVRESLPWIPASTSTTSPTSLGLLTKDATRTGSTGTFVDKQQIDTGPSPYPGVLDEAPADNHVSIDDTAVALESVEGQGDTVRSAGIEHHVHEQKDLKQHLQTLTLPTTMQNLPSDEELVRPGDSMGRTSPPSDDHEGIEIVDVDAVDLVPTTEQRQDSVAQSPVLTAPADLHEKVGDHDEQLLDEPMIEIEPFVKSPPRANWAISIDSSVAFDLSSENCINSHQDIENITFPIEQSSLPWDSALPKQSRENQDISMVDVEANSSTVHPDADEPQDVLDASGLNADSGRHPVAPSFDLTEQLFSYVKDVTIDEGKVSPTSDAAVALLQLAQQRDVRQPLAHDRPAFPAVNDMPDLEQSIELSGAIDDDRKRYRSSKLEGETSELEEKMTVRKKARRASTNSEVIPPLLLLIAPASCRNDIEVAARGTSASSTKKEEGLTKNDSDIQPHPARALAHATFGKVEESMESSASSELSELLDDVFSRGASKARHDDCGDEFKDEGEEIERFSDVNMGSALDTGLDAGGDKSTFGDKDISEKKNGTHAMATVKKFPVRESNSSATISPRRTPSPSSSEDMYNATEFVEAASAPNDDEYKAEDEEIDDEDEESEADATPIPFRPRSKVTSKPSPAVLIPGTKDNHKQKYPLESPCEKRHTRSDTVSTTTRNVLTSNVVRSSAVQDEQPLTAARSTTGRFAPSVATTPMKTPTRNKYGFTALKGRTGPKGAKAGTQMGAKRGPKGKAKVVGNEDEKDGEASEATATAAAASTPATKMKKKPGPKKRGNVNNEADKAVSRSKSLTRRMSAEAAEIKDTANTAAATADIDAGNKKSKTATTTMSTQSESEEDHKPHKSTKKAIKPAKHAPSHTVLTRRKSVLEAELETAAAAVPTPTVAPPTTSASNTPGLNIPAAAPNTTATTVPKKSARTQKTAKATRRDEAAAAQAGDASGGSKVLTRRKSARAAELRQAVEREGNVKLRLRGAGAGDGKGK